MNIDQTLHNTFGFKDFKPGQRQVVETIVAGGSAAAIFPTGAGKSLCYQLPALLETGMTLVISPLLSLMKDQIEFLKSKSIPAAKLDSGMKSQEYNDTLAAAREGKLKILMIAVERFKNERFRTQLRRMNVSLLVVDEAHCISEWGHNFRPDYLKLPLFQKEFNIPKALLLTATATPRVVKDMYEKFSIPERNVLVTGFYRENLFLRVLPTEEEEKESSLRSILSEKPDGSAIVYVTQQKTAEDIACMLNENGFDADAYHAGMKSEDREEVQNRFMTSRQRIVVATIAFGMGIDKENIRKIIHYDLPKSMEGYSQEIGRAGRDGAPALCAVLANRNNVPILENYAYGDTPHSEGIQTVLKTIKQASDRQLEIRPYTLSRETDIRLLPLKTLLVYLEMEQIISPKYTYFEEYPFKFLIPPEEIAGKFQAERKTLVQTIFRYTCTARTWSYPDIDAVCSDSGSDRQRVLSALEYFHEKGWVELRPRSGVEVYDILNADFDVVQTGANLTALFEKKEAKDISRIHEMIHLFEKDRCLAQSLSAYFGEELSSPCGRCTTCIDKTPPKLPLTKLPPLDTLDLGILLASLEAATEKTVATHTAVRFLCGITTPHLVQIGAKKMPGFGRLEKYPYKTVKKWVIKRT